MVKSSKEKARSLLGLAQRAGKLVSGEDTVERELSKGRIHLLIIAADSSDNTRRQAEKWSVYHGVTLRFFEDRGGLGSAIGKEWRAVVGVKDIGFSKELQRLIDAALDE